MLRYNLRGCKPRRASEGLGIIDFYDKGSVIWHKSYQNATFEDYAKFAVSGVMVARNGNLLGLAYSVADFAGYNPIDIVTGFVKR